MVKRYTIEYIKEYLSKYDYELLSTEYINGRSRMESICPNKHIHIFRFSTFLQGTRCNKCFIDSQRFSFDYVKTYIENEGYTLLDITYTNVFKSLTLICPNGHTTTTMSFVNFKDGHRCNPCYQESKGISSEEWVRKGGNEKEFYKRRTFLKKWTREVQERDKVCQFCLSENNLNAHHIRPLSTEPKHCKSVDNGILLCFRCHIGAGTGIHSLLGYEYSNEKWIEFASKRWLNPNFNQTKELESVEKIEEDIPQ